MFADNFKDGGLNDYFGIFGVDFFIDFSAFERNSGLFMRASDPHIPIARPANFAPIFLRALTLPSKFSEQTPTDRAVTAIEQAVTALER